MKMARSVTIFASNAATNRDQGELSYAIACQADTRMDRTLARIWNIALGAAILLPEVRFIFRSTGAILGGVRSMIGC